MDSAAERHIRNVLETFQSQSPKQAFDLCERYLKKSSKSEGLLAVKALLLVHMGRDLEGIELAKQIMTNTPTSLHTLNTLDKVFMVANDYKTAVKLFKSAFEKSPIEEVGMLWFVSVLRTQDFKELFAVALKLKSLFNRSNYLFWAASSLFLQFKSNNLKKENFKEGEDSSKAIKLCEKMLLRGLDGSQFSYSDEYAFLVMVLQSSQNFKFLLDLIERNLQFSSSDELILIKASCMQKLGQNQEGIDLIRPILEEKGVYDWTLWKIYIGFIEQIPNKGELISSLPSFLDSLQEKGDNRNQLLAYIDAAVLFKNEFADNGSKVMYIMRYVEKFLEKGCCLPDLRHIIDMLDEDTIIALNEKFVENCLEDAVSSIYWHQLCHLTSRKLQKNVLPLDDEINLFKDAIAQESSNDAKSVAACLHLAVLYLEKGDTESLCEAISYCQKAAAMEADNFGAKLLLLVIYMNLGCVTAPMELFKLLEIKQLQLDTLSYVIADNIVELGDLSTAEIFFHELFYIYDESRTQSWSVLAEAFKRGSYTAIPEIFEFTRKFEHSIQAVACICGTIRSEILGKDTRPIVDYLKGLNAEELMFDAEFIQNISDNRDFDIFDIIDYSCFVKSKMVKPLITFSPASVLYYTHLPLLLQSLSNGQHDKLANIIEKYKEGEGLIREEVLNDLEEDKLDFASKVINLITSWTSSDCCLSKWTELWEAFINDSNFNTEAEYLKCNLKSFRRIQWKVEMIKWIVLFTAMLHEGLDSVKRKELKMKGKDLLAALKKVVSNVSDDCSVVESSIEDTLKQVDADISDTLKVSWMFSIGSYKKLLESSLQIAQKSL